MSVSLCVRSRSLPHVLGGETAGRLQKGASLHLPSKKMQKKNYFHKQLVLEIYLYNILGVFLLI